MIPREQAAWWRLEMSHLAGVIPSEWAEIEMFISFESLLGLGRSFDLGLYPDLKNTSNLVYVYYRIMIILPLTLHIHNVILENAHNIFPPKHTF